MESAGTGSQERSLKGENFSRFVSCHVQKLRGSSGQTQPNQRSQKAVGSDHRGAEGYELRGS